MMSVSAYEKRFHHTNKVLLWLVASCLPVAGVIGFIGYALFHSVLAFWIIFGIYVDAFVIYAVKGYREYRLWQRSSKPLP
jgi:hypothetical protein